MGTVALISPMKNHLAVLNALKNISSTVIWHIYGPVKDAAYWKECEQLIQQLPSTIKVHYHGELPPTELTTAMQQIQLFIMPSKSENFGHALLEALSAGKPVITTDTTPFKDLQKVTAGFTVRVSKLEEQLPVAIEQFAAMKPEQFAAYCEGAASFARSFVDVGVMKEQYRVLFANPPNTPVVAEQALPRGENPF
jgi:glycosyltransferase involved in cell wall biosynthesis